MPDDSSDRRPRLFVGSSSESKEYAYAVQQNLDNDCEVEAGDQGVFGVGKGGLESVVERLPELDFAALLFTPDDVVISRGDTGLAPRDNVLLETGLFIGALGRDRTFMVFDDADDLKIPSDLAGVSRAPFRPHSSGNLQSSLGAACTTIRNAIRKLGPRKRFPLSADIDEFTHFRVMSGLMDLTMKQFLILMVEKKCSLPRERFFSTGIRYSYQRYREGEGRASGNGFFSVDKMCHVLPDAQLLHVDLRNNVMLTERGGRFADWLVEEGCRCDFFRSDVGGWGTPLEQDASEPAPIVNWSEIN